MKLIDLVTSAFFPSFDKDFLRLDNNDFKAYKSEKSDLNKFILTPENLFELLIWPPNSYAICAKFLEVTGRYQMLISGEKENIWGQVELDKVIMLGKEWRNLITSPSSKPTLLPEGVLTLIYDLFKKIKLSSDLKDLQEDYEYLVNLLTLLLASDECFNGINIIAPEKEDFAGNWLSNKILHTKYDDSFNLSNTQKDFGTVHYKQCVCQSGITLNSLSHNLAFIRPDIETVYVEKLSAIKSKSEVLNVLILPWPEEINNQNFTPIASQNIVQMSSEFGFFEYGHENEFDPSLVIEKLKIAKLKSGNIDLVVFPECAMSYKNFCRLANGVYDYYEKHNLLNCAPTIISGVFEGGEINKLGTNSLVMYYISELDGQFDRVQERQYKHHRWYLDRSQIFNYNLGSVLAPSKKWWEFIEVTQRSLISYYCEKHELQLSPLICEDLARQDPIGPVVRALGPNLIIALLMDGPQLGNRWPSRYASVLADDPGSSILSITALGMTLRSTGSGFKPSRTIGLWSEPGLSKELEVENDKNAIILTLEKSDLMQWTCDGRKEKRKALLYAGHISL